MKKCVFILSSILMVIITSCGNKNTSDANTEDLNSDSIIFDKGTDPNKQIEDVVVTDSIVGIDIIDDDKGDKEIKITEPIKEIVSNKYIDELKETIEEGNRSCPIEMGILGNITRIDYDEDLNTVRLNILINENNISMDIFNDKDRVKESVLLSLSDDNSNAILKDIINAKANFLIIYKGQQSNKIKKVNISNQELKEAYSTPIDETTKNKILLKNELDGANAVCPNKIAEGMIMEKVIDNGSYIIYQYKLDENYYDISSFNTSKDEIKAEIKGSFVDPSLNNFLHLLVKNNRGLIYRYYGDTSNKKADIKFTVSELKQNL